jgi:hypothetical protein
MSGIFFFNCYCEKQKFSTEQGLVGPLSAAILGELSETAC